VINATFSNISAISWRPVLLVEEAGVHGENHRPWASNWLTLSLAAASRVHPHISRYRAIIHVGCRHLTLYYLEFQRRFQQSGSITVRHYSERLFFR